MKGFRLVLVAPGLVSRMMWGRRVGLKIVDFVLAGCIIFKLLIMLRF